MYFYIFIKLDRKEPTGYALLALFYIPVFTRYIVGLPSWAHLICVNFEYTGYQYCGFLGWNKR